MRLWYFSSSVNSFFKRACAAIQWGLYVWLLIGPFFYFHTSCVWTAKALARLRGRLWHYHLLNAARLSDETGPAEQVTAGDGEYRDIWRVMRLSEQNLHQYSSQRLRVCKILCPWPCDHIYKCSWYFARSDDHIRCGWCHPEHPEMNWKSRLTCRITHFACIRLIILSVCSF